MEFLKGKVSDVSINDVPITLEDINLKKVDDVSIYDDPVSSKEVDSETVDDVPMNDDPVSSKEVDSETVDDVPMNDDPVSSKEVDSETVDDVPMNDDPVSSKEVDSETVDDVPMNDDPVTLEEVDSKTIDAVPMDNDPVTSEVDSKTVDNVPIVVDQVNAKEVSLETDDHVPTIDDQVNSKEVSLKTDDDLLIIHDQVTSEEENLDIVIHNITSSFRVGDAVDFKKVPPKYISLNRQKIQWRMNNCTIIIRNSGKCLCVGASSEDQALTAARKSIDMLKSWGLDVTFTEYKTLSYFCSCLLPWRIHMEAMVSKYSNVFTYEPEINNCCILTMKKGEGFLGAYSNGFIRVISPTIEMVLNNLEKALPIFSEFRI